MAAAGETRRAPRAGGVGGRPAGHRVGAPADLPPPPGAPPNSRLFSATLTSGSEVYTSPLPTAREPAEGVGASGADRAPSSTWAGLGPQGVGSQGSKPRRRAPGPLTSALNPLFKCYLLQLQANTSFVSGNKMFLWNAIYLLVTPSNLTGLLKA